MSIRRSLRALSRAPVVATAAVASIAIGVGANTAVYSWIDGLVLHPFPAIGEPDRVVGLEVTAPDGDGWPVSYPTFRQWRDGSRSFSGVSAWTLTRVSERRLGERSSMSALAMTVSGNYFTVLEGAAVRGRLLTPDDDNELRPVAVLGHTYWVRVFGSDPNVIGQTILLDGGAFTIVGVAAPGFVGTYLGVVPDLFVPIALSPRLTGLNVLEDRSARDFQVVARLAPGITREAAQRELDPIARRLSTSFGDRPVTGAKVLDSRTQYLGGVVRPLFQAMLVITGLLLLVACANVASLLLVRASERSPEMALRLALGASPSRVAGVIVVECILLAAVGSVIGVVVAWMGRAILYALLPTGAFPITLPIGINLNVLASAALTATVVAIGCGLVPALRTMRVPPAGALRAGSRSLASTGSRARFAIVAAQLAFSLLCLATAGLFVRGLAAATRIAPGFSDPGHVLLVTTNFTPAHLDETREPQAMRDVLQRVRALPGVEGATVSTFVPLGLGGRPTADMRVEGYTPRPTDDVSAIRANVGPSYARVMGIGIADGRDIDENDREVSQPVALVNETFARRYWPHGSAIGKRIDAGHGWATVVGVLRDGKYGSLVERPTAVAYIPFVQWPEPNCTLHIRTHGDPMALVESVRRAIQAVHVDLPALQPRTLSQHIAGATFVQRVGASVLGAFASIALFLSGLGLYAALASAIALRTRELGIRIAMGAQARAVLWSAVRPALVVSGVGVGVGGILAVIGSRVLSAQFPEIGAVDPIALSGAAALLLAAVALAAWAPTRRALTVDPITVLRGE